MAYSIVVEDGTGLSTANSYMSSTTANGHLEEWYKILGLSAAPTVGDIDCTTGTYWLDTEFVNRWKGFRLNQDQALAFPRVGIVDFDGWYVDSDEVPAKIVVAASIMAYYANTEASSIMPNQSSPGTIKREKKKAAVIEKEVEYMGGKEQEKYYRVVEDLLRDFITAHTPVERS